MSENEFIEQQEKKREHIVSYKQLRDKVMEIYIESGNLLEAITNYDGIVNHVNLDKITEDLKRVKKIKKYIWSVFLEKPINFVVSLRFEGEKEYFSYNRKLNGNFFELKSNIEHDFKELMKRLIESQMGKGFIKKWRLKK